MRFDDGISLKQSQNLNLIIEEIARHHQANPDDFQASQHPNAFLFETSQEHLYQSAVKTLSALEDAIKNDEVISKSKIKKALSGEPAKDEDAPQNNVVYLKNIELKDKSLKNLDNLKRIADYFKNKISDDGDLSIEVRKGLIKIQSGSTLLNETLESIFLEIGEEPKWLTASNRELDKLLSRSTKAQQLKAKIPEEEAAEGYYNVKLEEGSFSSFAALKKVFNNSARGDEECLFIIKNLGNAEISARKDETSINLKLPRYSSQRKTETVKSLAVAKLSDLGNSASRGDLRTLSQRSITKSFSGISRIKQPNIPSEPKNVINRKLGIEAKPKPPEKRLTSFSVPPIDRENNLVFGEKKRKLSNIDVSYMRSLDEKIVLMSMCNKDKEASRLRPVVYKALEGLKKRRYDEVVIAGEIDQYAHIDSVMEEIDFLLGHGDIEKGQAIRKNLMAEKRIIVTGDVFAAQGSHKQGFTIINGCQDYSYSQLTESLKKVSNISTVAYLGTDLKYSDPENASAYKFFFDKFTKGDYAKYAKGFLATEQQSSVHELVETMLLNGDDEIPKILAKKSQQSSPLPSPEHK